MYLFDDERIRPFYLLFVAQKYRRSVMLMYEKPLNGQSDLSFDGNPLFIHFKPQITKLLPNLL